MVVERTRLLNVDESSNNNARVFVVDDDADTRNLLMAWLQSAGMSSEGFDSGSALLERLETERPDAVCLDVRMPEMDGIEVLRRLKGLGNRVPVVMLTADEQLETAVECMKLGAFDYQVKPLLREATIGVLRAAVRESAAESTTGGAGDAGASQTPQRSRTKSRSPISVSPVILRSEGHAASNAP